MEIALLKVRSQALFAWKNISDTHQCSDTLITFCHILASYAIYLYTKQTLSNLEYIC